jgi:HD-GYP domain-containing protein (c-di-GMP phosphodiesterase class II)
MPQISEWAAFHHERLDGRGYPFRHAAEDLTLGSRIMAVADVFTAISEDRPYRKGMSSEQSRALLSQFAANGGLDGDIVQTLDRAYEDISERRRTEQVEYGAGQEHLRDVMRQWAAHSANEPALSNVR